MPVSDLTTVKNMVTALLNAGPDNGTWSSSTADDARRTDEEIAEAVFQADEELCLAIMETPGAAHRNQFIAPSGTLTHGGEVPEHFGPVQGFEIAKTAAELTAGTWTPGEPASRTDIFLWRANPGNIYRGVESMGGYYWHDMASERIYFTGAAARALIATFTRTAVLQSPQNYQGAIVAGAISKLAKEGDNFGDFGFYLSQYRDAIQSIRGTREVIPAVTEVAKLTG